MIDRRQFLKLAGISTILGLGGASALSALPGSRPESEEFLPFPEALTGKRWGMVIDVAKFESEEALQKCINVCHKIHNVPSINDPVSGTRQEVKWIWEEHYHNVFPDAANPYLAERLEQLPFPVLCNHCDNPPCVRVCPTKATYKRPDGIVMMDMHRCIGCRFCMAACPYGSRSFNFRDPRPFIKEENPKFPTRMRGVVEKCNFCAERLAEGKQPACAEASGGAMIFGDLADPSSEVRRILRERYSIRRKPELGTNPSVFYVI